MSVESLPRVQCRPCARIVLEQLQSSHIGLTHEQAHIKLLRDGKTRSLYQSKIHFISNFSNSLLEVLVFFFGAPLAFVLWRGFSYWKPT